MNDMVSDIKLAQVSRSLCSVHSKAEHSSEATSELMFGESVKKLDIKDDWTKIEKSRDGYTGYVESAALEAFNKLATHWVRNRSTFIFERPDFKSPVLQRLLFGSELNLMGALVDDKYLQVQKGGFVWAMHCQPVNTVLESSLIDIARQHYLNAPYLWGGRSTDGCDCSGFVQMIARAKGINLPRDSGDQERSLVNTIEFDKRAAEDLVFWPKHVGILTSQDILMHATAYTLQCCLEPLDAVIQRAGYPSSVKRVTDRSRS